MTGAIEQSQASTRGVSSSWDLATAYVRRAGPQVAAIYLAAVAPLLIAGWLWIDVVTAEDRPALGLVSASVVLAMLWRWAGLAWLQSRVMLDAGFERRPVRGWVVSVVLARLLLHCVIVWGGVIVLPGAIAFYVSGFVGVAILRGERSTSRAIRAALGLVIRHALRVWQHALQALVLILVGAISLALTQAVLVEVILPSVMGIDAVDLRIASRGTAWWLALALLGWLAFDLVWTVAAVFMYEELESRHTGGDLALRLARLEEALT